MANITYRASIIPSVPSSTTAKGTPLTNLEVDGNFKSINDDVVLRAPITSPTFLGTPAAPTAVAATNTTQLATTEFVTTADNLKANLLSPTFTGTPAAPTAVAATNTTQLATTAHVFAERTNAATLTNKTLTTPTLTNPVVTNPTNTEVILVDGATVNWDLDTGHTAKWAITATGRTLNTPTNQKVGGQYVLYVSLVTPATMTPTWPASIVWPYGTAPDLTTSTNTLISLVWSSTLSKFLGSYTPGY